LPLGSEDGSRIAAAKLPFVSTVVSASNIGVENNHTCTGVAAMKELVAISNGVDAVAVRTPLEPLDGVPDEAEPLFDESLPVGAKPANAILAGPADISATPPVDVCTSVSTGTPPNIAFDSPAAT